MQMMTGLVLSPSVDEMNVRRENTQLGEHSVGSCKSGSKYNECLCFEDTLCQVNLVTYFTSYVCTHARAHPTAPLR